MLLPLTHLYILKNLAKNNMKEMLISDIMSILRISYPGQDDIGIPVMKTKEEPCTEDTYPFHLKMNSFLDELL